MSTYEAFDQPTWDFAAQERNEREDEQQTTQAERAAMHPDVYDLEWRYYFGPLS